MGLSFKKNELLKKSVLYRGSTLWNNTSPLDRNIATFLQMLIEKRSQNQIAS